MLTPQEKIQLKQEIISNQHEVLILSIEEMDKIMKLASDDELPSKLKEGWKKLRGTTEFGANWAAAGVDALALVRLFSDFGSIGAQVYIKEYGGKAHIILKGYPGLRKIFTGTKYGVVNPKVVTMGLGRAGAMNAVRMGGLISIIAMSVFRVTDYFLADEPSLSLLFGSLATDIVKIGIATGVGYGAVALTAGMTATLALGPLAVVLIVGVVVVWSLGALDEKYEITKKLVKKLDEISRFSPPTVEEIEQGMMDVMGQAVEDVIDYAVDSATDSAERAARDFWDRWTFPRPRF